MFGWITSVVNWAIGKIPDTIRVWVHDLISGVYGLFHNVASLVGDAWDILFHTFHNLRLLADEFTHAVSIAFHWLIKVWIPALNKWIDDHLLKPLLAAWQWIHKEGAYMLHLLTVPLSLVNFFWTALLHKIEVEAWTAGRLLGRFFLSLIAHNVRQFLQLMEDILSAIL